MSDVPSKEPHPEITRAIALRAEAHLCWQRWMQTRRESEQVSREVMRDSAARRQQSTASRLRQQGWSVAPFVPPLSLPAAWGGGSALAGLSAVASAAPAAQPSEAAVIAAAALAVTVATAAAAEMIAALARIVASELEMPAHSAAAAWAATRT